MIPGDGYFSPLVLFPSCLPTLLSQYEDNECVQIMCINTPVLSTKSDREPPARGSSAQGSTLNMQAQQCEELAQGSPDTWPQERGTDTACPSALTDGSLHFCARISRQFSRLGGSGMAESTGEGRLTS